ncbi:hypothetical protein AB0D99_31990 [Streptomyces sp. NPDC047971]|uniref:hypothetical protein n=1 Tax=Streptomyces sp. NPDC047971 TaxID=3154499 RepID=UPI0033E0E0A4
MSDQQAAPEPDMGEQRKERAAAGCLLVVAVGIGGCIAYAVPETAYYAAGLATSAAVRKVHGWVAGRRTGGEEQPEAEEQPDIVPVLQQLGNGGQHVLLTSLKDAAGLPDTKAVRALLEEAGVPVRAGVRADGKNGPGVHQDDIPAPSPGCEATPSGRCLCSSEAANTNANNGGGEGPEKGFRVEHTGQAGTTVYDLSETHHRHTVTK